MKIMTNRRFRQFIECAEKRGQDLVIGALRGANVVYINAEEAKKSPHLGNAVFMGEFAIRDCKFEKELSLTSLGRTEIRYCIFNGGKQKDGRGILIKGK